MRVKLQAMATAVCIAGILLGAACKTWLPEYWFDWYPVILVAYWLMEMVMSFVLERGEKASSASAARKGQSFMKVLMISKTVKMLVTLVLIGTYLSLCKEHQIEFVCCAVAFYLINLGIETYAITNSKNIRKQ